MTIDEDRCEEVLDTLRQHAKRITAAQARRR